MPLGQLWNITSPYSFLESWFYDTLIAPPGAAFYSRLDEELPENLPSGTKFLDVGCGGYGSGVIRLGRALAA